VLVGGGAKKGSRARSSLLKHVRHTIEANGICIDLLLAALRLPWSNGGDSVATWRSAAACARGALRPDSYVMIDQGQTSFGFFLEYDRGTESGRDYRRKFGAYHRYAETGRFARDYEGFPIVLFVTNSPGAEKRIAEAGCAASVGQAVALPFLLSMVGLIRGPEGPFGPIWRVPADTMRQSWPLPRGVPQHPSVAGRRGRGA